jgi:hypothetical protein
MVANIKPAHAGAMRQMDTFRRDHTHIAGDESKPRMHDDAQKTGLCTPRRFPPTMPERGLVRK